MSNKITGDELVYPTKPNDLAIDFTKREVVLKDFMCALIASQTYYKTNEDLAIDADELTTAYFNQLNKENNNS